jgi:hypothetical protein
MALRDIVDADITRVSSAVTQQGFSTPLILAYQTRRVSDRVHSYASLDEMAVEGYTPDDAAYKLAQSLWAQPSPPRTVKIGRRANAFTSSIQLTPTAVNSVAYTVEIDGQSATYTSDSTALVSEIVTGLVAAINALGDVDAIVATGGSTTGLQTLDGADLDGVLGYRPLSPSRRLQLVLSAHADWDATTATVTGKDAGGNTITETFAIPNGGAATVTGSKLFARVTSVEVPIQSGTGGTFTLGTRAPMTATDVATHITLAGVAGHAPTVRVTAGTIAIDDLTTNPGLAADLAAVRAEDDDWYALILDSNSRAEILAAAAIVESLDPRKVLFAQTSDTGCLDPDSITDVMYLASDLDRFRTVVLYHPTVGVGAAAAYVGNALAYDPGTVTWKFRELVGLTSYTLTSAQRAAVLAKSGNLIETVAGRSITCDGKVSGGEWIDVIHGLDWLRARMAERVFGVFVSQPAGKVPFTDKGIALLHTEVRAQLQEAQDRDVLATGWTTSVPTAASLSSAQRQTRVLPNVTWNGRVTGAIHAITIRGTVAA